jgi:hypothetical protein
MHAKRSLLVPPLIRSAISLTAIRLLLDSNQPRFTLCATAAAFAADTVVLRVGEQKGGNRSLLKET